MLIPVSSVRLDRDVLALRLSFAFGNIDAAFAKADHVLIETFSMHRGRCHLMECRGVIAAPAASVTCSGRGTTIISPFIVVALFKAYGMSGVTSVMIVAHLADRGRMVLGHRASASGAGRAQLRRN
jgi:hypothetical protein